MPTVNHSNGLVFKEFSNGMLDDLSVADSVMPSNAVRKAINVMFDRPRGAITQRLGTTKLGDTLSAGNAINGLFGHRVSTAAYCWLLGAANGVVKYLNGSAVWTTLKDSWTTTAKVRFLTYLDSTAIMNGTDAVISWTGNGAVTTTGGNLDVANFPITKFATVLNSRVFAAGNATYPYRLYASSLQSASAISWTAGNKNIDIYPNDGSGVITGLSGNGKVILIFKERTIFRYDDNSLDKVANIGTTSYESIVTDDNGVVYFFGQGASGVGFYKTTGGFPVKISRQVTKWVEAIASTFYTSVVAYMDGKKIVWSIGSATIDGTVYSNACLVYNIADQTWEARNYADSFRVFSPYIDANGAMFIVGGDTDGMVQKMDTGTTDNGSSIVSECEFAPILLSERGRTKKVDEMLTYATHFQGLDFLMKTNGGDYKKVGSIISREQEFPSCSFSGHTFYPKITCVNSGTPFQFDGFNFVMWGDEGYS